MRRLSGVRPYSIMSHSDAVSRRTLPFGIQMLWLLPLVADPPDEDVATCPAHGLPVNLDAAACRKRNRRHDAGPFAVLPRVNIFGVALRRWCQVVVHDASERECGHGPNMSALHCSSRRQFDHGAYVQFHHAPHTSRRH